MGRLGEVWHRLPKTHRYNNTPMYTLMQTTVDVARCVKSHILPASRGSIVKE